MDSASLLDSRERAYSVALNYLHDGHEADEVAQDAMLEAWKRSQEFDPDRSSFPSWVGMIARSRAIDRLRRNSRRAYYERRAEIPPSGPLADEVLEKEESTDRLRLAFHELGARHRAVLELVYVEGLTHAAVAERLSEPLGTVKTRIRLALARLRQITPR